MEGACSVWGAERKWIHGFGGTPAGKRLLEDLSVDGNIILKWILRR